MSSSSQEHFRSIWSLCISFGDYMVADSLYSYVFYENWLEPVLSCSRNHHRPGACGFTNGAKKGAPQGWASMWAVRGLSRGIRCWSSPPCLVELRPPSSCTHPGLRFESSGSGELEFRDGSRAKASDLDVQRQTYGPSYESASACANKTCVTNLTTETAAASVEW